MTKKDNNQDSAGQKPQQDVASNSPKDAEMAGQAPMTVHAQYIRDLSFENPHAPQALFNLGAVQPQIDINFAMDARKTEIEGAPGDLFEVVLTVTAKATREGQTLYIAEIEYASVCALHGVPEDKMHPMLLIEMPRLMFPFVRQALSDVTQQAGFPPLLLAPVDFRAFYLQRYGQKMKEQVQGEDQAADSEKTPVTA